MRHTSCDRRRPLQLAAQVVPQVERIISLVVLMARAGPLVLHNEMLEQGASYRRGGEGWRWGLRVRVGAWIRVGVWNVGRG